MSEFKARIIAELDTSKIEQQINQLNGKNVRFSVDTGKTQKDINGINNAINSTYKNASAFGDTLKKSLNIGAAATIAREGFQLIRTAANNAVEAVKELDGAIVELRMATNQDYEKTRNLVAGYNKMAKELGSVTTQVTASADSWLRQGKSINDTSTLIRDSMILSKVGQLDSADATQYLTSAMKGYKVEAEGALNIVDKLTAVDLESATNAGGLAEGMSEVAVTASNAGISMDKLLGYLAATGEVTQESMSTIGTSFKTIFTRMSDIKSGKLELIDEDGTTEILSDVEQTLANVGINLRKTVTEYNDYGDVLDNLAAKWDSLSQLQQNALAKAFAGTRQQNRFRVLMENYDNAKKYMDVAANSVGTAENKFSAYLDSIEAKVNSLQAAFESLVFESSLTDMYSGIVEGSTAILEFLDNTKLLQGTLSGLATAGAIEGIKALILGIQNSAVQMSNFSNALTLLSSGSKVMGDDFQDLLLMTENLSKSQLKAVLSSEALSTEQRIAILTSQGMTTAQAETALSSMGLATAEGVATASTVTLSSAVKGLWATLMANPLLLIVAGVTAGTMAINALTGVAREAAEAAEAAEEQAQKSKEIADNAKAESESLSDLINKYKELAKADRTDSSVRTEIRDVQDEITSLVGLQADNLDLVNGKLDEELAKLQSISAQQISNDIATYRTAYNDAKEETQSKNTFHEGFFTDNIFGGEDYLIDYELLPSDEELKDEVTDIIKNVIQDKYGDVWNGWGSLSFDFSNIDENDFQSQLNAVNEILKQLQNLDGYDTTSSLFEKLTKFRDSLQETYDKQVEQGNALIDILITDYDNSNRDNVDTFDKYVQYRNEIIEAIKDDSSISEMISEGVMDNDSISKSVDNYLGTLDEFSDYYNEWYDKFASDTAKGVEEVKNRFRKSIESNTENFDFQNLNKNKSSGLEFFPNLEFSVPKLSDEAQQEINDFNEWIDSLSNSDKDIVYKISTDFTSANVENQLNNFSDGGTVDLTIRPTVDNSELKKAGWDVSSDGTATVFTSTFSNSDGSVAINFTPIVTDEKGNYKETLSPEALQKYAEGVIAGTREDDLKLQIGAEFTGDDAIDQAVNAAEKIHLLQDYFYLKGDPSDFSLDDWKSALDDYKVYAQEVGESVGGAFETLITTKGSGDSSTFRDRVDEYADSMSTLNDTFEKFQKGDLEPEDIDKLTAFQNQVLELGGVVGSTAFSIDIDVEADNMDKLYSAMKESVTSTGLTSESIQNLTDRYKDLKDFNANSLFEKTANGIHLNTKELRQLESEYENQIKTANNLELTSLTSQYENLTKQIKNCDDATEAANLYARRQDILDQIDDTTTLAAQYDGLTSSFKKWEEAQSLGEEGDMYDSLQGGLEHIKELYDEGLIGTNEFRAAVQLMSNEDLYTASIDELLAAYDKGYEKMTRYFTESSDGCLNFLNDVSQLNSEWVKLNDDGSWDINFGVGDDANVAEKLGLDIETVQSIMRKLSDYGFDINLDSIFTKFDYLQDELKTATDKLKELGLTKTDFDFNTDSIKDVNSQIDEAQKLVDGFKDKEGKIDLSVEGAMEAETVLVGLMNRQQELSAPTVMHVDVSKANDDITNLISYLKDYQTNYNDIELKTAIGADTSEAETHIGETLTKINEIPKEVKTKLGLDDEEFADAVSNIQADVKAGVSPKQEDLDTVQKTISDISPEMMVEAGLDSSRIDNYEPEDKKASVEYTSPTGQAITDYQNSIDKWQPQSKTATITYTPVVNSLGGSITSWISGLFNGGSKANGTAYVNGTAKAKGDWSTKEDGEALGGELGQEMVVRDGHFFTIGDNGAEFFKYKRGDIIFSAEQTRQILQNGKITSGKKRGMALAEGTAFSSGSGKITASGKVITTPSGSKSDSDSDKNNNSDSSNDSTQTIDYLEIAIDRIQRAVNKLKKTAESAFKSLKKRLNATSDEIEKINEEIAVQNTAYSTYMAKANSINLSSSIKQLVRNGSYSITDYDSDTASLINEYKQYYEAALDCKEAVQDLNDELAQLYKDKFDLIEQDFDNQLSRIENKANHYESQISLLEAQNYFVSSKYYKQLANQEQNNIAMLNDKYAGLQEALDEAVGSGRITKDSEAWYEMQLAIEDTKAAIDDATVSLAEYEDEMREIDWSVFDYLQDRISQINTEADFLIDLMSNSDMFDEVGNFTDKGLATAGLHGVNYNTYMAQADKYAKELVSIQNQLADDPADTRLIERKEELLDLQQQSIKNAEDEKQAIKSLVEDGIKVQLDSLQDLIDTYTDSLDKAKSFYDYQNKIEDKTSAIAEIQKQLAAYENNLSEETQAKVQTLKVDLVDAQKELAETEYEQYISDTKQLLDNLYDEYEAILNERLDNIDVLMEDMIETINLNSGDISATLRETGESVGYTLTDNMTEIWSSGVTSTNNVISTYGDGFLDKLTSLNETLNNIAASVNVVTGGRTNSTKTTTKPTTITTTANKTNSNTSKTNSNNSTTKQGNGKGEIGDKVTYTSGIYHENSAGGGYWGNQYLGKSVYITSTNPGSAYPYHISTGKTLGNGDLGWVKLNQLKGYKTGGLVDYTGLAQLDGTPDKPELVLNAKDTENFVSLRDTLREMSKQPLSIWGNNVYSGFEAPAITAFPFNNYEKKIAELQTAPNINQNNNITVNNDIDIDHVQDYNDIITEMKKDNKFEDLVKAIVINPLNGKSSLAKHNIYWN